MFFMWAVVCMCDICNVSVCVCVCVCVRARLTCVVEAAIGERQEWGIEGALRVPQDGIMFVDVFYNLWIEFILLYKNTTHKHT